jgi:hypothetical protein
MRAVGLHLNLEPDSLAVGGSAMARTTSNSSTNSYGQTPLTPVGQTITTPTSTSRRFMLHRLNSISSVGTSDDDDSRQSLKLDSFLEWPKVDDDILMTVYQAYIDNPTSAPFAGRIPPSGLIHQVAKATLHEARRQGRPFGHDLNAIRKRLLLLCGRQQSRVSEERTTFSPVPLRNLDAPATPVSRHKRSTGGFVLGCDSDGDEEMEDDMFGPLPMPPGFGGGGGRISRPVSPFDHLRNQQQINSWLLNTPSHVHRGFNGSDIMPMTPSSSPITCRSESPGMNQDFDFALASPFRETAGSPSPGPEESTVNYTSQRKRASLRMKRGMTAN